MKAVQTLEMTVFSTKRTLVLTSTWSSAFTLTEDFMSRLKPCSTRFVIFQHFTVFDGNKTALLADDLQHQSEEKAHSTVFDCGLDCSKSCYTKLQSAVCEKLSVGCSVVVTCSYLSWYVSFLLQTILFFVPFLTTKGWLTVPRNSE